MYVIWAAFKKIILYKKIIGVYKQFVIAKMFLFQLHLKCLIRISFKSNTFESNASVNSNVYEPNANANALINVNQCKCIIAFVLPNVFAFEYKPFCGFY